MGKPIVTCRPCPSRENTARLIKAIYTLFGGTSYMQYKALNDYWVSLFQPHLSRYRAPHFGWVRKVSSTYILVRRGCRQNGDQLQLLGPPPVWQIRPLSDIWYLIFDFLIYFLSRWCTFGSTFSKRFASWSGNMRLSTEVIGERPAEPVLLRYTTLSAFINTVVSTTFGGAVSAFF